MGLPSAAFILLLFWRFGISELGNSHHEGTKITKKHEERREATGLAVPNLRVLHLRGGMATNIPNPLPKRNDINFVTHFFVFLRDLRVFVMRISPNA